MTTGHRPTIAVLDELLAPPSPVASRALEAAAVVSSPALLAHSRRSAALAVDLGRREGLTFDHELLFVAAALHDVGLAGPFDSHAEPFERAGAEVARVFASGAGWSADRAQRLVDVIVRHAWPAVSATFDVEGHLLERATSLDVSGVGVDDWPAELVAALVDRVPRDGFGVEFGGLMSTQAHRKPGSEAARTIRAGMRDRIAANPLDRL
ncbi:HD domain-containing protein [Frigoribacterium sp. VKM Ac-1396]|uniref:HD domain-containing protein n=1 Tax=Frigoribacterium sp. VKM Ac-1396 TaxID=2783821 RepID=UPI00188D7400|nr:HD domain-containing protein [Frigoribacterium sp. VKM Ac-1396]MBF4601714.1 HD domain-containing protein [Frigoribacterium sp. VKM Ac-1396]